MFNVLICSSAFLNAWIETRTWLRSTMGMLYSKSTGRRAQAVDMLKQALAVSPNDLAFLKALAPLLAEMSSAEEAALCLNRAIVLDPADNHRVVFT